MTTREFSDEFDVNINSHPMIQTMVAEGKFPLLEFNEYEKSIFLTKAQEMYITQLYRGNNSDSFETTEELRRLLSNLVSTKTLLSPLKDKEGLTNKSKLFELPKDVLYITYEQVKLSDDRLGCLDQNYVVVVPVRQDELYRVLKNPFRRPNKNKALRLDIETNRVEIISDYNISEYQLRYVRIPNPIILENLPDGLKVNGSDIESECELNPILHKPILDYAVELALKSRLTTAQMYAGGSNKE